MTESGGREDASRCLQLRSRLVLMEGKVARVDNGLVVAESKASFMIE